MSDMDNEDWYILKLVLVVDPHQNIIQENPKAKYWPVWIEDNFRRTLFFSHFPLHPKLHIKNGHNVVIWRS